MPKPTKQTLASSSSEQRLFKSLSFDVVSEGSKNKSTGSKEKHSSARAISFAEFVSKPAEEVVAEWRPTLEENRHVKQVVDKASAAIKNIGSVEIVEGGAFAKGTNTRDRDEATLIVLLQDLSIPDADDPLLGEWLYNEGSQYTIRTNRGVASRYLFCEKDLSAPLTQQNEWWVAQLPVGRIRLKQHETRNHVVSNFMKTGADTWDAPVVAVSAVHKKLCEIKTALEKIGSDFSLADFSLKLKVESVRLQISLGGVNAETEVDTDAIQINHDNDDGEVNPVVSQVAFIKHQDARYKDLVRYCKVWRNIWQEWPPGSWIKSFLLELLALDAYQRHPKASIATLFVAFLEVLQKDSIDLAFSRWYDAEEALLQSCFRSDLHRVLDPANPSNNLAQAFKQDTWSIVQYRASETLGGLTAVSGTAAILIKRLRSEIACLKEALLTHARQLGQRIEFDVSSKATSKEGEVLKSPDFKAMGVSGLSLHFYPNGTESGARMCSLIVKAPAGTRLRYRLFVDDTEKGVTDRFFDSAERGWGFSAFCAVKKSYSHVGIQIFQAAFSDPGSSISIAFEPTEHEASLSRVTWDIRDIANEYGEGVAPKKACIESDKFAVDGMDGMYFSFYPNGDSTVKDDYCSLYLNVPESFFKWTMFVDDFELGPLHAEAFLGGSQGYRKFCPRQESYLKVGVVISEVRRARHPAADLRIYV